MMNLSHISYVFSRFFFIVVIALPTLASAGDIVLMANKISPVLFKLKTEIEQQLPVFKVTIITQDRPSAMPESSYIVSVGTHTVNTLFREKAKGIISILVTENQNKQLYNQSAIYVEPPFNRQLILTQALFPNSKIGVLVANEEKQINLKNTLTEQRYSLLNIIKLSDYQSLNLALFDVLKGSDVLLGVYDNTIYNSKNIKNILITSYRQQKVLIGPSKAYLKAGSFVSTFSNLSHITKRLGDIILTHRTDRRWIKADYNPYYEIVLNQQVGYSLNIPLPNIEQLVTKIRRSE